MNSIREIIKIKEGCYDNHFESFFIEYIKEADRKLIDSLPLSSCMEILDDIITRENAITSINNNLKEPSKNANFNIFGHIDEGCKY